MELLKIEQVIVGSEMMSTTSAELKTEPVTVPVTVPVNVPVNVPSPQPYQHESLQCFQCFITFCNVKSKERHMRKCHREEYKLLLQQSNTVFTCYVCDRSFSCSKDLTQHQISHNAEDKPFRCNYCQGTFRTFTELTTHRRQECSDRRYFCKECNMVFRSSIRLRTHLSEHSQPLEVADEAKTYHCGKCNCRFQTEKELIWHQECFADDQNCNVRPPPKKRGRPPKKAAEREVKEAGGSPRKQRGRPPKEPQQELKIPCPEANCDLIFPSIAALRAHKKDCHGPPPPPRKAHLCTECEESYARPEQLKAHVARAHSSGRHNCPTCGKSFGRESNLKAHQKTHTEGEEAADDDIR